MVRAAVRIALTILSATRTALPILLSCSLLATGLLAIISWILDSTLGKQPIYLDDVESVKEEEHKLSHQPAKGLPKLHILQLLNLLATSYAAEGITLLSQACFYSIVEFSRLELVGAWATLTCLSLGTCLLAIDETPHRPNNAWLHVFAVGALIATLLQLGSSFVIVSICGCLVPGQRAVV